MSYPKISEPLKKYICDNFEDINTFKSNSGADYITFNHQGQRHMLSKSRAYIMTRRENTLEQKEQYINVTDNDYEIMDMLVSVKSGYIITPNKCAILMQTMLNPNKSQ